MSIGSGISNATALDSGGKGALAARSIEGTSGSGASADAVRSDSGMFAPRAVMFEGLRSEKAAGSSGPALAGGAARLRDERF
jgi:hypothetical protein